MLVRLQFQRAKKTDGFDQAQKLDQPLSLNSDTQNAGCSIQNHSYLFIKRDLSTLSVERYRVMNLDRRQVPESGGVPIKKTKQSQNSP